MEETRLRTVGLVCKVLLQHLNSLIAEPTFPQIWVRVLHTLGLYMRANDSDYLVCVCIV